MIHRFYNAGTRLDEKFRFSDVDGGDIHFIGYWPLNAPKEGWFDVPTEIEFRNTTIGVQFVRDLKQKYGPRGVVMLDPSWDPKKEDPEAELWKYPLAPTEALVIERADKLWRMFLRKVVESHLADCQSAMAAGGAPRAAAGFTKSALKILNIQDPGEQYFLNLEKGKSGNGQGAQVSEDVKAILISQGQMMQTLTTLLIAQASGEKLDAETIKKLLTPVQTPETLTSGVMTGKPRPIENRPDGLEAYNRKVKDKKSRNQEAVAAL